MILVYKTRGQYCCPRNTRLKTLNPQRDWGSISAAPSSNSFQRSLLYLTSFRTTRARTSIQTTRQDSILRKLLVYLRRSLLWDSHSPWLSDGTVSASGGWWCEGRCDGWASLLHLQRWRGVLDSSADGMLPEDDGHPPNELHSRDSFQASREQESEEITLMNTCISYQTQFTSCQPFPHSGWTALQKPGEVHNTF